MLYSSMTLLLSPDLNSHRVAVARRIIYRFVENFVVVYGIVLLTYKLHSLIHIADDCDFYQAPLDAFSCFPFESFLGQIKRGLRRRRLPVAQLKARQSESANNQNTEDSYIPISNRHNVYSNFNSLKTGSRTDAFCIIGNGVVVKVRIFLNTKIFVISFMFFNYNNQL